MKDVGVALLGAGLAVLALLLMAPWDGDEATPSAAAPPTAGSGVHWDGDLGGYVAGDSGQITIWKVEDGKVSKATTHWLGWDLEITPPVYDAVRRKGPDGEEWTEQVLISPEVRKRVNFRIGTGHARMAPEGASVPVPAASCGACSTGGSCG